VPISGKPEIQVPISGKPVMRGIPNQKFERVVNTRALIYELLNFVDDVLDPLGSREAAHYAEHLLKTGTGADRQLKVFQETGSLINVMDYISGQFLAGI